MQPKRRAPTGGYVDSNDALHGFVRTSAGKISTLNAPHAGTGNDQGTTAFSINQGGEIVGNFVDSNYVSHGFLWNP